MGYTLGMKTAISIPDDLFAEADRLAHELGTSRSQLYSRAIREFIERHSPDRVTASLNAVCKETQEDAEFAVEASRRMLKRVEW